MIALAAPSIEAALAEGLGRTEGRARLVDGCAIPLALPSGFAAVRDDEPSDAIVASVDASSIDAAETALVPGERGVRVAWIVPVEGSGALAWLLSRARRLRPIALEDACDALRRRGVTDVHVVTITGSRGIALVHGWLAAIDRV